MLIKAGNTSEFPNYCLLPHHRSALLTAKLEDPVDVARLQFHHLLHFLLNKIQSTPLWIQGFCQWSKGILTLAMSSGSAMIKDYCTTRRDNSTVKLSKPHVASPNTARPLESSRCSLWPLPSDSFVHVIVSHWGAWLFSATLLMSVKPLCSFLPVFKSNRHKSWICIPCNMGHLTIKGVGTTQTQRL